MLVNIGLFAERKNPTKMTVIIQTHQIVGKTRQTVDR
jgi:hypothetical protein